MNQERKPMHCDKCDMDMNMHAEKIDYTALEKRASRGDTTEPIVEIHTCPGCGDTAIREAQ